MNEVNAKEVPWQLYCAHAVRWFRNKVSKNSERHHVVSITVAAISKAEAIFRAMQGFAKCRRHIKRKTDEPIFKIVKIYFLSQGTEEFIGSVSDEALYTQLVKKQGQAEPVDQDVLHVFSVETRELIANLHTQQLRKDQNRKAYQKRKNSKKQKRG